MVGTMAKPPLTFPKHFRWIQSEQGRARQMNAGAHLAQGEYLLFLHADSRVPSQAFTALERSLAAEPSALHYSNMRFAHDGPWLIHLNSIGVWIKSHLLNIPFGDQGFCLQRAVFEKLGGFDESVLFGEDHFFLWKARHKGIPVRCTGAWITTSARKYREQGWLKTTALHVSATIKQIREAKRAKARGAIAIFVKTPGLSPIKTRLANALGNEATLEFYQHSLTATRALVRRSPWTPYWAVAENEALKSPLWSNFEIISQGDGTLGQRLHRVYSELLQRNDFVLLMGADSPQLEQRILTAADTALKKNDFVLGRATDGGFYLFGGRKKIPEQAWTSVQYSTRETADQLRHHLSLLGTVAELETLCDVDTIEDLRRLSQLPKGVVASLLTEQKQVIAWAKRQLKQ